LSTGLDPQDAEAVLGVLVRDPLDQAGEHLAIRAFASRPGSRSKPVKRVRRYMKF
jgi:hypothetical protein